MMKAMPAAEVIKVLSKRGTLTEIFFLHTDKTFIYNHVMLISHRVKKICQTCWSSVGSILQ